MGTDRFVAHEEVCRCGNGTFRVYHCSPDHGWSTSARVWYEATIRCKRCAKKYKINEQDGKYIIVKLDELADRKRIERKAHKRADALLRSPDVKELIDELVSILDRQRHATTRHHFLTGAGLELSSIQTFRKSWQGGRQWALGISYSKLPNILRLLGKKNKKIAKTVARIDGLYLEAEAALTRVGKPVFKI